jgi:spore maturation protein CgeB
MKLLVHGVMADGQHALQRTEALERAAGVEVVRSAVEFAPRGRLARLAARIAQRLRWPIYLWGENRRLLAAARAARPDFVLVENRSVIRASTLARLRAETGASLAYLCPDDAMARHNLTGWLKGSFPLWDVFFTTKSFNVAELRARGVRNPVLIGNIYTPALHRPLSRDEVGEEFEAFDLVFVGQYERDRAASLAKAAAAGLSVLVHGPDAGLLYGRWASLAGTGIVLRPAIWGEAYVRALHHGKIVLGFLRKGNRDRITQRSIEVPAMARPMLAEKTEEHDRHFVDGAEYVGFGSDGEMIEKAKALIADPERRRAIGEAGRRRCLASGYDVDTLAGAIVEALAATRAT